jgi:hypothetical protein
VEIAHNAGLLTQMDQLEEIVGPINEEHTLVAYGQMFILNNRARALMHPCVWYTFKFKKRGMWYSVFPKSPDECLFNLWMDNRILNRLIPYETEARPNLLRYHICNVSEYRDYWKKILH